MKIFYLNLSVSFLSALIATTSPTVGAETSPFGKALLSAAESGLIEGIKSSAELDVNTIGIGYHGRVIVIVSEPASVKKEYKEKIKNTSAIRVAFNSTKSNIDIAKARGLAADPLFKELLAEQGLIFDEAIITKSGDEISFLYIITLGDDIPFTKNGVNFTPDTALKILKHACKASDAFWTLLHSKGVVNRRYSFVEDSLIVRTPQYFRKEIMDATGISYNLDNDGDAVVIVGFSDDDRKQRVWVTYNVTAVGNYKLRKVFTYAYAAEKKPNEEVYIEALKDNGLMDTSRWSLSYSDENKRYALILTALVPEVADGPTLASIIRGVATRADNFEKKFFEIDEK